MLPFGLPSAPYIFTKCIRPLVKHWRAKGHCIVVYLDDGWGTAPSLSECHSMSTEVKQDLLNTGLVPNVDKSVWDPVQELNWLGMKWNSQV